MLATTLLLAGPAFLSDLRPAWVLKGQKPEARGVAAAMGEHGINTFSLTVFEDGRITSSDLISDSTNSNPPIFQLGSLSKVVAAVTALRLVDRKALDLETPINRMLGDWKLPSSPFVDKKSVTLKQLLNHTSGLGVGGFRGYAKGQPLPTLNQMLDGVAPANSSAMFFQSEPGTSWSYSGGGYLVLQKLLEVIQRQPYATVAGKEVLSQVPMAMSRFSEPPKYVTPKNPWGVDQAPLMYPEQTAAGLWSSTEDFATMIMSLPRILRKGTLDQMLTKGLGNWGLGVGIGGTYFWHSGRNIGYDTVFFSSLDCRTGFVAAINCNDDTGFLDEVTNSYFRAKGWNDAPPFATKEAFVWTDPQYAEVEGSYEAEGYGKMTIRKRNLFLYVRTREGDWIPMTPQSLDSLAGRLGPMRVLPDGSIATQIARKEVIFKKQK